MASNNPFSYGNPVSDPRRFIGRNQEVGQIYSRLRNPEFESNSLVGERRMGKTSLFNYISHPDVVASNGLDTAMYLFVHLDLQMVEPSTTPTRLYQHMCRRISNRTEDPDVKEQLNQVSGYDTIDTYDLSDACDVIDQKGIHVVLLMDEFENIAGNANFGPEFYYGLRSLAIHHNLALVTSSQNDLVELSRSDAVRSSPFFNIFATINLQPLATGDVQRLLEGYLSGSDITFQRNGGAVSVAHVRRQPLPASDGCVQAVRCLCPGAPGVASASHGTCGVWFGGASPSSHLFGNTPVMMRRLSLCCWPC